MPFPPLSWWQIALRCKEIYFDAEERYQKMTFRNRFYLAGPQGKYLLSVPLKKGRGQRLPVGRVVADSEINWQTKHWRTIQSLYGRAPFFEYFAEDISTLFENGGQEIQLFDWCLGGIGMIAKLIGAELKINTTTEFQQRYSEDFIDVRCSFPEIKNINLPAISYHQVFQERTGFIADCSILDLLFCKGNQLLEPLLKDSAKG